MILDFQTRNAKYSTIYLKSCLSAPSRHSNGFEPVYDPMQIKNTIQCYVNVGTKVPKLSLCPISSLLFFLIILHSSCIAYGTSAIFPTTSMLTYMLSRQPSTVQSCSLSRLYKAATAFGLNALLLFLRQSQNFDDNSVRWIPRPSTQSNNPFKTTATIRRSI